LVDLAAQVLRHNHLLAAMPLNTLALLAPDLRKVSLEQGAVLFEPGELIENIYFPLTGLISLTVIGKDGRFIEARRPSQLAASLDADAPNRKRHPPPRARICSAGS
jgi:hypothetical protein